MLFYDILTHLHATGYMSVYFYMFVFKLFKFMLKSLKFTDFNIFEKPIFYIKLAYDFKKPVPIADVLKV